MAAIFEQLLGNTLLRKDSPINTTDALSGKVVALYFSAHWCPPCRGFTPKLASWYSTKLASKGLEVVFISSDNEEEEFLEYFATMPWLALPYDNREQKANLSKKFKVKGIPTLIILDSDGSVITHDGRSAVSDDPDGEDFPWRPRPFHEILGDAFIGQSGAQLDKTAIAGKTLGLYFSAHWCPPCRHFTPELAAWYKVVAPTLPDFEVIFVSSDRTQENFNEYFAEMPWLALPYAERKRKDQLSAHFEVNGIPTFVIVDPSGRVINPNGRAIPDADPEGKEFPWEPKPLKDIALGADGINETPSLVALLEDADADTARTIRGNLDTIAQEYKAAGKAEELLFFYGGADASGVLGRVRALTKQAAPPKKHEHPLEAKPEKKNWNCDGCDERGEGVAYSCAECDFDFCKECNSKAVDVQVLPVAAVLLDVSNGGYFECSGVDLLDLASIRGYLERYHAGSLQQVEF